MLYTLYTTLPTCYTITYYYHRKKKNKKEEEGRGGGGGRRKGRNKRLLFFGLTDPSSYRESSHNTDKSRIKGVH